MADIITRAGKGSNLTPTEVDSNFKNLNAAILAIQGVYGTGTVSSVSTVYSAVNSVLTFAVTNPNTTPVITVAVTGSVGYVKSSGSALSTSATIPFTDTTGTVPINRGGTNLTSLGSNQTLLGSNGSSLIYRTLSSTDSSILFDWSTSGVLKMVVDPSVININSLSSYAGIAKGGTGATTRQAALNNLANASGGTTGYALVLNGSGDVVWGALSGGSGTVTSVGVSTTGVSSVLSFSIGGTATINPTLNVSVTGTAGYLKSDGSTLTSVANQTAINELTSVSSASIKDFLYKDSFGNASWSSTLYVNSGTNKGVAYLGSSKELITDATRFYYNNTANYYELYAGEHVETKQRFVSATGAVNEYDLYLGIDSTSSGTLTLPASSSLPAGKRYVFKDITGNMQTRSWIINGNGTTIDNSHTYTMNSNYQSIELILMDNAGAKFWSIKSHYKSA